MFWQTDSHRSSFPKLMIVGALLFLFIAVPNSHAEIKNVQMHISGLLCNHCARELKNFLVDYEGVQIAEIHQREGVVHIVPDKEEALDLYDLIKDLRDPRQHSAYVPWKTVVEVEGELMTFVQHYEDNAHTHERYALRTADEQTFVLLENPHLEQLLQKSEPGDEVSVVGEVPTFDGNYPLLVMMSKEEMKGSGEKEGSASKQGSDSK